MERTTITCHFAHVWTHGQVKGGNLLVLLALADAADDDGSVRTTRQHIADRARVNRSTVHSAMAALFASGELMRYNAEAPDVVICVIRTGKEADKSAPCDNTESEFANDDTGDTLEAMSDFATQDEPRRTEQKIGQFDAETEEGFEDDPEEPLEDFLSAFVRGGTPPAEPIEVLQIAPPPVLRRMIPKHLPPGDLDLVLAPLGVEEDMRGSVFWYEREQRAELDSFLDQMPRTTADNLALMITERRIGAPDLDRVASILKLVSKRGGNPPRK